MYKKKKDNTGNFLALDIVIEGSRITVITIYGPNQDSPDCYDINAQTIDDFENDNIVICGYFDLVLNPEIDYDKNYKNVNNPKARDKVCELVENYSLVDIYREQHEESRRYTWRKSNHDVVFSSVILVPGLCLSDM